MGRETSPGGGFLYRIGRLVVDAGLIEGRRTGSRGAHGVLRNAFASDQPHDEKFDPNFERDKATAEALGLTLLSVPRGVHAPTIIRRLRSHVRAGASLDHVLVGDPHRFYGCDPAEPVDPPGADPSVAGETGSGKSAAILDTGIYAKANLPVSFDPGDEDELDGDTDHLLDAPAGHGTFVTGVIARSAPSAKLLAHKVLRTPAGLASELEVATALLKLPQVDVINCSFGGPSQDDAPPLVIERALATLPPDTVVIASAGNSGDDRPHYPAASKRAFGIGWVHGGEGAGGWELHDDSSRGPWVDASAPGSDIESDFVEFPEASGAPTDRTFKGGARWSGTSFSAPAVTAAILALASRDGISAAEAAYRLITDPSRPRIANGGTLVVPGLLP